MKKILISSIFLFVLTITGSTQNLVKNPDFEQYITCPYTIGRFSLFVKDWYGFLAGDASYFNSCGVGPKYSVPQNNFGYQPAHSGEGYVCICVFSWDLDPDRRMYIEGFFSAPLLKDTIYCINYYVSLVDVSGGAIQNVDALISDTLMDWNQGQPYYLINIIPQIRSSQLITDSVGWTRISDLYIAHGGEKYITIGNFRSNATTNIIKYKEYDRVDYYVDDVSVAQAGMGLRSPYLGNDTVICRSALPLHLAAPPGYDTYEWSNGANTSETDATTDGKFWVRCIVNGCGSLYSQKIISFDTPLLELGRDTVICKGESILLSAQAGFSNYLWNTGDTTQTISATVAGNYSLQTLDRCGPQSDNINVQVDTIPNGIIELGKDTTLCDQGVDKPVVLMANIQLSNYAWSTGDTSFQITVTEPGIYRLQSSFRCGIVSDSITVDECPPIIFFPNAFTPNNDGRNDVFRAVVRNVKVDKMVIFNSWGQKLFESIGPLPEWDGTFKGEPAPGGLYTYLVYCSDEVSGNKQNQKRGVVMLLR